MGCGWGVLFSLQFGSPYLAKAQQLQEQRHNYTLSYKRVWNFRFVVVGGGGGGGAAAAAAAAVVAFRSKCKRKTETACN